MPDGQPFRPLLAVRNLRVEARLAGRDLVAVDGVSFTLSHGRTLGIVGESGSGKSLTARAIMGLLPANTRIAGGEVCFEGVDLRPLSDREMRRRRGAGLAMIFQDPLRSLDPTMRVGEQIVEAITAHHRVGRAESRNTALALLDAVRIPAAAKRLDDYPHHLSGGMRQRVMIAIALAGRPRLLIADEPTTALDVTTQAEILDLLRQLQQELDMAMVLITHDMGVASECTDRIAVMYAGRLVEEGPTNDVFARPRMPYTRGLLDSVVDVDTPPHALLHAVGGRPPSLAEMPSGCRFHPRCTRATAQCAGQAPRLAPAGQDHRWACWLPLDGEGCNESP
ncbi:ABC transporter ATP-binding protein [Enhydrobacter sp.]|jgi:oligopeptide/dipeptide ABC transporter ATP-binding protein|uniref:ABC transporter ATP-binding protein n=1 Tax=Enhydrobacter sp. TaxID=1894999 RepID=UPI00261D0414|nr:ABC transporter ATP-binding protein [Enhydrobacter sp.]WIM09508.1 MAG: oligopeptide transport system permease protein OppB [Enhydrobacter sp.]